MKRLLDKLNYQNVPMIVSIIAESFSMQDNCFYNVLDKVEKDGGQIIYGWKLHISPFLAEAERHAVWESPTGELIDITPDPRYTDKIFFLEEEQGWVYNGEFVDNVRVALVNNLLVDDYILLSETITKLWQTGRRKSKTEILLPEQTQKLIQSLEQDKAKRLRYILENNSVDSNCYCGSLLKYKDCHGKDLQRIYGYVLEKVTSLL